ncbi:hypothetical protein A4A49_57795, partial [Nicotiana attenuata]
PSTGEKPPDHPQNERNIIAHPTQQESFQNSSPIAADLQNGAAITVAKNRLGTSEISQVISGSNLEIPNRGDYSPHHSAPSHQISTNSTVGIFPDDLLQIAGELEMAGNGVPAVQMQNQRYQKLCLDQENMPAGPISHGYLSNVPILQKENFPSSSAPAFRRN